MPLLAGMIALVGYEIHSGAVTARQASDIDVEKAVEEGEKDNRAYIEMPLDKRDAR